MSSDTRQRKWAAILFTDMVACGALARPEEKPTQELREGRLAPYALNSRTKNIPMKTPTQYRLFLFAMFAVSGSAAPLLTELTSDNRLLIRRAGAPAPLLIQNARADSRPFIHPLAAPDGNGVLTEDSPAHHKWQHGLYVGLNQVNGHDFWKRDEVFHPKPMAPPKVSGHTVQWVVESLWTPEAAVTAPLLLETQRWTLTDLDDHYWLDLEWTLAANVDVTFGRSDYGGLFLRMPWTPTCKGDVVTSDGAPKDAMRARWMAVRMDIQSRPDGATVAILDHPQNVGHPSPWRVDGQLGIAPSRCIAGEWKLATGRNVTTRYRVVVRGGRASAGQLESEFRAFSAPPAKSSWH